jgi:ribosome-binding protein aMBF1 (putative translation factor)
MTNNKPRNLDELLDKKYGKEGVEKRELFEAKALAFYLCEMLKEERKKASITQQKLADKLNMKKSFISRIENGKVDVQLSTFIKLLHGIGLDLKLISQH